HTRFSRDWSSDVCSSDLMITPSSIYDYDMSTHKRTLLKRQEVLGGYDPAQYRTERQWATARDGVKIPLSIVYRTSTPRDGGAPRSEERRVGKEWRQPKGR